MNNDKIKVEFTEEELQAATDALSPYRANYILDKLHLRFVTARIFCNEQNKEAALPPEPSEVVVLKLQDARDILHWLKYEPINRDIYPDHATLRNIETHNYNYQSILERAIQLAQPAPKAEAVFEDKAFNFLQFIYNGREPDEAEVYILRRLLRDAYDEGRGKKGSGQ